MYRTFLRSARNFEEFGKADKIEQSTDLTYEEARAECQAFNGNRSDEQQEAGTKLEFEEQ